MRRVAPALTAFALLGGCGEAPRPTPVSQQASTREMDGGAQNGAEGPGSEAPEAIDGAPIPTGAGGGAPAATTQSEGLTPPEVRGELMPIWPHAVVVSVTPENVLLGERELARLDGDAVAPDDATSPIVAPLEQAIIDGSGALGRKVPALVLVVDEAVVHEDLSAVLARGAQAGFRAFALAATREGELGAIVLDPMLLRGLEDELGTPSVPVITVHEDALVLGEGGERLATPSGAWPRAEVMAAAAKIVPAAPATPRAALRPDAGVTYGQLLRTMDAIRPSLPLMILLAPEASSVPYQRAYDLAIVPRESAMEQALPDASTAPED